MSAPTQRKLPPNLTELPGIVIPEGATIASLKSKGEYDYQTNDAKQYITDKHFKVTVTGPRRLFLARFRRAVISRHVKSALPDLPARRYGLDHFGLALVEDCLAVGAHPEHRKLQREFSIIALGSSTIVNGRHLVPYLRRWHNERHLDVDCPGGGWGDDYSFLIVGFASPKGFISKEHSFQEAKLSS